MAADRLRSSVAKQEALMRLVSADPSLLGSLDDALLASLTLAAPSPLEEDEPPSWALSTADAAASSYASATRHTLIDPRLSFDVSRRTTTTSSRAAPVRLLSDENDVRASKRVLLHAASAPVDGSSSADAAATLSTEPTGRGRSNAVTRESVRYPRKLVSLLDDEALAEYGDLKAASTPSPSPAKPRVSAQMQQPPLPPSVVSPRRGSSKKKKAKATTRQFAPAAFELPAPPLLSAEQQYEFGGHVVGDAGYRISSFDAVDRSTVESTHSSSRDSSESDDSCASASSVSLPDTPARPKAAAMDHRCFVARAQWVAKSARRSCAVCERDFGVLRKRHSCRMCGEVICSRCSVFRAVNLSVVEGKCRICSCCSVSYRKKLEDVAGGATAASASDAEPEDAAVVVDSSSSCASPAKSILLTESTLSLLKAADDDCKQPAPPSRYDSDLSTLLNESDDAVSSASLSSLLSLSFSSSSSSASSSRHAEEELEAARRAQQLEAEVAASRGRIEELEARVAAHESQSERLSGEQQRELADARQRIGALQEQLQAQEASARAAAATRDTLCLANLRQAESYGSGDDESRALKKKLRVLERQLQQAGISVAEVIPYEVAKAKVSEIARRLQEIGSSELVLADKLAQAAARREYYQLEQDMEKFNTALVMTDEYAEEQRRQEAQFEAAHADANARALRLLRSAVPVELARLSEAQLRGLATPSGVAFPGDLAKRLKRTNVLQLLRADPKDIARMHPSVVEGLRTSGLALLERRALHAVLAAPSREWCRQQRDDMSLKKFQWYSKLRDALESAVLNYAQHCESSGGGDRDGHACKLLGLACPVRAEAKVEALYAAGLGFPDAAEYAAQEVVKSDPDGAGEKARQEAQSYAREAVANQRQRELKAHYKLSMRQVAQAMGALEDADALVERLKSLDAAVRALPAGGDEQLQQQRQHLALDCECVLQTGRELVLLLARRAGICVVGKRDADKDEPDNRSPLERHCAASAAAFLSLLLDDVRAFATEAESGASGSLLGSLRYVSELLEDVKLKNASVASEEGESGRAIAAKRVPWSERSSAPAPRDDAPSCSVKNESTESVAKPAPGPAPVLPTSASLFDAIRARKQQKQSSVLPPTPPADSDAPSEAIAPKPPIDLFAAIRARKAQLATSEDDAADAATRSA